ncbi:hypothetical protein [Pyrobaculum ferrireducens]|uniref:Uncharacterized protein n=1 Tax=Pyrobaculum ferrireducens TaxID=1104324 RepID=G7VEB3_9CREN|nr:hypothetical protein [Pyrobaculum ferrireducens]AET34083.1 hypothetical protein P186_2698 [Pyrobaculum ferrireducens]
MDGNATFSPAHHPRANPHHIYRSAAVSHSDAVGDHHQLPHGYAAKASG